MAKRRLSIALAAVVLGAFGSSGVAVAADAASQQAPRQRVLCERLQEAAHNLRARIGQIQALQERIRARIASGELTREQEARAKHALRRLEALQQGLVQRLERMLALYEEKCTR